MTLEILLVATFYATCAALTLDSVVTASAASEVASSVAVPLRCTSENEVCLPANYSRFQLPNKGMQTKVSIGKLIFFLKYLCIVYKYGSLWSFTCQLTLRGSILSFFKLCVTNMWTAPL